MGVSQLLRPGDKIIDDNASQIALISYTDDRTRGGGCKILKQQRRVGTFTFLNENLMFQYRAQFS